MKVNHLSISIFLVALLIGCTSLFSQLTISVNIISGNVTTDCNDLLSAPDPMFSVAVQGQAVTYYANSGNCFTATPNVQYEETFDCFADVPPEIEICYSVFENDPGLFNPCGINEDCLETICSNYAISPQGVVNYTANIIGNSQGSLDFSITTTGIPAGFNDFPCDALDFGLLNFNQSLGRADTSIFNNFCSTNLNEPNDFGTVGFWNNNAVWFEFTTGPDIGAVNKVIGLSDPSGFGDNIGLQIGLFESLDGTCNDLQAIDGSDTPPVGDESLIAYCLNPNTSYYVMIDGDAVDMADSLFGYFGLEIMDLGAVEGANFICEADELGIVPEGGSLTSSLVSNGCADNVDDPNATGIFNGKGVWFTFTPPLSGHVNININGEAEDEMNIEFAVLTSDDNSCTGTFSTIATASNNSLLNESRELSCLNPQQTYYILVDGQGSASFRSGVFRIEILDAGEDTPIENQTVTLCAGETLPVGSNIYDQTGIYSDTIILSSGCDSIVNTDLTVLPEIFFDLIIEQPGIGENMPNGIATITAIGGTNSFNYNWSNGIVGQTANNLVGNETYCIDVMDTNNCLMDTCFIQPLILNFLPMVSGDSLACNGDSNGTLSFAAQFGFPPYDFSWASTDGQFSGDGTLLDENDSEVFSDLPAGTYVVNIEDMMFDTTFTIEIWEPEPITLNMQEVINATCFGVPNGEISIDITGGTPPYITDWSTGINLATSITNLLAGEYNVIIADDNACVTQFFFEVTQPDSITLEFETSDVSCFEGSDGSITVSSPNTTITDYLWLDLGETTPTVNNLSGGVYAVGILDEDGCPAIDSVEIDTPAAPLEVVINLTTPIVCNGGNEGALSAIVTGPGGAISYNWSNGANISEISTLTAGIYTVTVANENGCQAEASFSLAEPDVISAEASTIGVTCPGGLTDGILTIDTVFGGQGPYLFSENGIAFSPQMEFTDQTAGPIFYYVQDNLGCIAEFQAEIEDVPNIQVDLGEDLSVQLGDSIQLSAAVTAPNLIYTWEPIGIADCDDCFTIFIRPMESLEVMLTILDPESGCTDTDEVFIEVNKERRFYAPNAFSPNDDGINDKFLVFGDNDVQIVRTLKVFNRYGALVFEANNFLPGTPDNAWNGFFRNKRLNPDVFGWFAEVEFFDGAVEIYRGDVTLLR